MLVIINTSGGIVIIVRELFVVVPSYVEVNKIKKRRIYLNLNVYRNQHRMVENNVKRVFCENLRDVLEGVVLSVPIEVEFRYYKPTNRISDKSNVFSVASKYMYDALVHYGCIEDDNDNFIKREVLLPTEYSKGCGRFEFRFRSI